MQNVSATYRDYISRRTVSSNWLGTITFEDGTSIDFDSTMLDQNKSKLTKQCVSGENLEVGNVFASELIIGLRDKAGWNISSKSYKYYNSVIDLRFRLYEGNQYEDVYCGRFRVNKAERTYHTVVLTAYDNINKFNEKLQAKLSGTYDPYDAISAVCTMVGVTLGMTRSEIIQLPNGNRQLKMSVFKKGASLKDLLGNICAILGSNAICNRQGELILLQYGQSVVKVLDAQNRYSSSYIDYKGQYTTIFIVNKKGEVERHGDPFSDVTEQGIRKLAMNIGKNLLINAENADTRDSILNDILLYISEIIYSPCNITMPVDPAIDVGDLIEITGGELGADSVNILAVKIEMPLFGQMKIVSEAGSYELDVDNYYTESERQEQERDQEQEEKNEQQEEKNGEFEDDIGDLEDDVSDLKDGLSDVQGDLSNLATKMAVNYIFPYQVISGGISDGSESYVLRFRFKCDRDGDTIAFYSMIGFSVSTTVSNDVYHDCVVIVKYFMDDSQITSANHTYGDGDMILTLNGCIPSAAAGEHTFDVKFAVSGGSLS